MMASRSPDAPDETRASLERPLVEVSEKLNAE